MLRNVVGSSISSRVEGAHRFTSAVALIRNELVLIQPLQGVETEGTWGVAMTVETEDFDRGDFRLGARWTYGLRNQPYQSHAAITESCRSV